MKTILFTGGGSAGHVTPNLALIPQFLAAGWKVLYAGSKRGIESEIIPSTGLPYYAITTGKLRRYFSWRTFFWEPFAILLGIGEAFWLCRKKKPDIVFSKGGFVAFPIVVGAWLNKIPIVVHESDLTSGLANKLSFPFANKICMTFNGGQLSNTKKTIVTGTPIRENLLQGNPEKGREFCQFDKNKPILLVIGGGLGSTAINQTIRAILPRLTPFFQVIHLCGKGKVESSVRNQKHYKQIEYADKELPDLYACSDIVVSRAGANSIYELLSLKKPHLLIPLSRRASRGDQIVNANYFAEQGFSHILREEDLTPESLYKKIHQVYREKKDQGEKLESFVLLDSNYLIFKEIERLSDK